MVYKKNIKYLNNNHRKKQRKLKKKQRKQKELNDSLVMEKDKDIYDQHHVQEKIDEEFRHFKSKNEKHGICFELMSVLMSVIFIEGLDVKILEYFTDLDKLSLFSTIPKLKYNIPTTYTSLYVLHEIPIRHLNMCESINITNSLYINQDFKFYMFENVKHIRLSSIVFTFLSDEFLDKFPKLSSIEVSNTYTDVKNARLRNIIVKNLDGSLYGNLNNVYLNNVLPPVIDLFQHEGRIIDQSLYWNFLNHI